MLVEPAPVCEPAPRRHPAGAAPGYRPRVTGDPAADPPGPAASPAPPAHRLGGALVDGALLQVVALAFTGLDREVAAALGTAAYLAYVVAMVAARGQTLGKLAMGAVVVDAHTGRRPTLWQAATRGVVPMAGVLVDTALGAAVVGLVWIMGVYGLILVDQRRRGLHDRAAGTEVVSLERSAAHRRAGAAAVAVAVAVTAVLVSVTLRDLDLEAASHGRHNLAHAGSID